MNHPQVVKSPIVNDCLKVKIDGHNELQLFPKLLLQVSVRELHNNLVSDTDDGGIKGARYAENNIIISNYTLRSLLPTQLKNFRQYARSCVVVNFSYLAKLYIPNYYHGVIGIKKTQVSKPKCSK